MTRAFVWVVVLSVGVAVVFAEPAWVRAAGLLWIVGFSPHCRECPCDRGERLSDDGAH